jgi:hypothetical protein
MGSAKFVGNRSFSRKARVPPKFGSIALRYAYTEMFP